MKLSTSILVTMMLVLLAGVLAANLVMKKSFDKMDKNDTYWNYRKVLEKPFRYLKVLGGNSTKIAFEQSPNCSIRVLDGWYEHEDELITTSVKDDTLFVKFVYNSKNPDEKWWMGRTTLVRIFSPELLSIDGYDTNIGMYKLKQKNITISMAGKSSFEMESNIALLDNVVVSQRDSSQIVIEMSPEYQPNKAVVTAKNSSVIMNNEAMAIGSVKATMQGNTMLDIGHAQVGTLQLTITDSAAILLSGGTLKKFKL